MNELDILKAIPPKVVEVAYDDAASPAMKELGKLGLDLIKTVRWVLSPLQFIAARQDRLAKHLAISVELVPEDRRITPAESLTLPILEELTFHDESSVVGHMFERLLARAMDRDRVGEAHPAFVRIVSQLAPDEAALIQQIACARPSAYMRPRKKSTAVLPKEERAALIAVSSLTEIQKRQLEAIVLRPEELVQPDLFYTYIEHLESLGIVAYTNEPWNGEFSGSRAGDFDFWFIELNGMGELFYQACLMN